MKTIRIPQGNDFSLFVPLVLKDGTAVEGERLSDIQVLLQSAPPRQSYAVSVNVQSNYVVVTPQVELPLGSYDLTITAKYENRDIAILLNNCFAISTWTNGSDYEKYLVGREIVLEQQVLIGAFNTDAELETLKEQYRTAITAAQAAQAEAETAKEAFNEKAEQLEDVAQETTSQEILSAVNNIDFSPVEDKIDEVQQDVADVKTAVENIDFSELAKQGTNENATNTAILEAAQATAALNSEVLAGKQAIVDAINDKGGASTLSEPLARLAEDIEELITIDEQGIIWETNYEPRTLLDVLRNCNYHILEIHDNTLQSLSVAYQYAHLYELRVFAAPNCKVIGAANVFNGDTKLEELDLSEVESINVATALACSAAQCNLNINACTSLVNNALASSTFKNVYANAVSTYRVQSVNISEGLYLESATNDANTNALLNFGGKILHIPRWQTPNFFMRDGGKNVVDLMIGLNRTTSLSIANWTPSNVLADPEKTSILNENIRLHIAGIVADLSNTTAATITFSQNLRNALETATEDAFAAKNWNIAPARTN